MMIFLLNVFYFLRPIMSINIGITIGGFNFFELMTITLLSLLLLIIFIKLIKDKRYIFTSIDIFIFIFVGWCSIITMCGLSEVDFKAYLKWILPPMSYVLITKSISSKFDYHICLKSLVYGISIAILLSTFAILSGFGSSNTNFWTGLSRHSGLYGGSHTLGHNAGFLVISLVSFLYIRKFFTKKTLSITHKTLIFLLFIAAGYCLAMSHVRTVIVGLFIFFIYIAYIYNKRMLVLGLILSFIMSILIMPLLHLVFFDIIDVAKGEKHIEEAGSGRPFIWKHNLTIFSQLNFEHQLIGIGIGNVIQDDKDKTIYSTKSISIKNVWNSHNDYLETMMQTGIIGLLLQISIYFSIFLRLLKRKDHFRYIYIGAFLSITVMNFLSNSYISRFGMAQMFYMYFAWINIPQEHTDSEDLC